MNYEYSFDFGENPSFVIDAWFKKAILPVLALCVVFFPLCYFSSFWITRLLLPAIAIGALVIFFGVVFYRRLIARQRISNITNTVFNYRIDNQGLHFDNEIAAGVLKWGFKAKLIPLKNFILLQSHEFGPLPLPADIPEEVLAFVESKLDRPRDRGYPDKLIRYKFHIAGMIIILSVLAVIVFVYKMKKPEQVIIDISDATGNYEITMPDGTQYQSPVSLKEDISEDIGMLRDPDGTVYVGDLIDGQPQGKGRITYPGGASYEGEFNAGLPHGNGLCTYSSGETVECLFVEGQRQ